MSKIFDNVADVVSYLGVPVSIPSYIPEDITILCYSGDYKYPYLYKQNQDSLQYTSDIGGGWRDTGSKSLEEEVEWDVRNGYKFAYLRLTTKDNSNVFTPDRLLGVETTEGFVTSVFNSEYTGRLFINATNCRNLVVSEVEYYISDDSDETVSFEEYVNKFYDGGVCGDK